MIRTPHPSLDDQRAAGANRALAEGSGGLIQHGVAGVAIALFLAMGSSGGFTLTRAVPESATLGLMLLALP